MMANYVPDLNLVSLMKSSGYNITQDRGQRKFGPPNDWIGPPPPKGCEIFIGKLPRDVYEDELVPLCEQFGKIYELRLMMDFNGENRGYSFITYTNTDDATRAIKHLNGYEIRHGRHIGVCKSFNNCRLFVGGIPKDKSKEAIMAEMRKHTKGVSKITPHSSVVDKSNNRSFIYVEYETHQAAALARHKLLASKVKLFDHDIAVDWAQPEQEPQVELMDVHEDDEAPIFENEPFYQSMPVIPQSRSANFSTSSSSNSSLLQSTWQYTGYQWKKRHTRCIAKGADSSKKECVPPILSYFPAVSSSEEDTSSSSIGVNVQDTCISFWKKLAMRKNIGGRVYCERCNLKYTEQGVRFVNAECFHNFCDICIKYLYSAENPDKPITCCKCHQKMRKLHNRYI